MPVPPRAVAAPPAPTLPTAPACVLALPGAERATDRLAMLLRQPRAALVFRRFPDGESYLRIDDPVAGREVLVVAALKDPDPQLATLLFAADLLRDLGAARIGLVAPYLPYMRQDARFRPGEALTSRSFARRIGDAYDWLVTVDPHLHRYASLDAIYPMPTRVVPGAAAIAIWIRANVAHPHVVGPDEESAPWAAQIARLAGCGHSVCRKLRHGDREVEIALPPLAPMAGCTPVLIDDIAASGHTLAETARALRAAGLPAPDVAVVHALLPGDAERVLRAAGIARLVSCDTIPHPSNAIDILPAVAEAIRIRREEAGAWAALAASRV